MEKMESDSTFYSGASDSRRGWGFIENGCQGELIYERRLLCISLFGWVDGI